MSAVAASSAASLTELELLPHSSSAAVMNAPTTYGSMGFPIISQKALISKRDPSLAFAGVDFPLLESVPVVTFVIVVISSALPKLARLIADALGFNPPELASLLSNVFVIPPGKSIFCISFITPQSFRTNLIPRCFPAIARSAAAPDLSLVVLAVWGLLLSSRICSPIAIRHMMITLFLCSSFCKDLNSLIFARSTKVDAFRGGATDPRLGGVFFIPAVLDFAADVLFADGTAILCLVFAEIVAIFKLGRTGRLLDE
mmetsp:Transcript_859/g.1795  ORF Transcript_859/g.1795 Transcript_859/m.1795 type:complete len:257 (-) Transcript_859:116-886(-)